MSQPLKSSAIRSYDVSGSDLVITFTDGGTYSYVGAAHHASSLRTAPSAGKYFRNAILGQFDFVKL